MLGLSPEEIAAFERDGLLRLPRLIDPELVRPAREALLTILADLGLWTEGSPPTERPAWPDKGLRPRLVVDPVREAIEVLFKAESVRAVVAAVLGGEAADHSLYPRPQPLISLPNRGAWALPGGWHTDTPRLASGCSPGVQLFTFMDRVEPRGGGTLMVAGSHRLLNDRGPLRPRDVGRLLRAEPFFKSLFLGRNLPRGALGLPVGEAAGGPVEVVELTGDPGDVWLADLRLLHAAAPNAVDRPRMMATHRYVHADRLGEIAAAFAWKA